MSQTHDPVIGQCRKCHTNIFESHPYVWCAVCNEPISDAINTKRKPHAHVPSKDSSSNIAADTSNQSHTLGSNSRLLSALMYRYSDAYLAARAAVGIGALIKFLGFALGGLIFIAWAYIGSQQRDSGASGVSIVLGLLIGGAVALQFYIWGVIVSALGQIVKGVTDSAVNGSSFLTQEHKAKMMSLPES